MNCKPGKGEYILYHGNLGVAENRRAAEHLIKNVFSKISHPVIIAGLNPSASLYEWVKGHEHITIIPDPKEPQMQELLENAHVHCLYTHQATGLKLKLLNVLYSGRFCVCNDHMLEGTSLQATCIVKNSPEEIIAEINSCFKKEFTSQMVEERKESLVIFDNDHKTRQLIRSVFASKKI